MEQLKLQNNNIVNSAMEETAFEEKVLPLMKKLLQGLFVSFLASAILLFIILLFF